MHSPTRFGEHDSYNVPAEAFIGGVASCSSNDMIRWRNEGIMFHYNNITDDVFGSDVPLRVERPKILVNNLNNVTTYVMWMYVDNANQSYKLAGVATSPWPDGPYFMQRTFRPDNNLTIDMTVFQNTDTGKVRVHAFLSRLAHGVNGFFLTFCCCCHRPS